MKRILVAIGGNSLIKDKTHQSLRDQYGNIVETARQIVGLIDRGFNVAISHGNGPQSGFGLERSELGAKQHLPEVPLDIIDAETEGQIGYQLQQALYNELIARGLPGKAVSVITQVRVDENDPAFRNPSKPVGGFYDEETANLKMAQENWTMAEQQGRGWRRLVASPEPLEIVDRWAIDALMKDNGLVICLGGGGVPVIRNEHGFLQGIPAVIDKDKASLLLAQTLGFDAIMFSTGVDQVYLNFNTPQQKELRMLSVQDAEAYWKEGHFPNGSMGPKIESAIRFLKSRPDGKCYVTDPSHIVDVLSGNVGTTIYT